MPSILDGRVCKRVACDNPLRRRPNEPQHRWVVRKYCSQACVTYVQKQCFHISNNPGWSARET